MFMSLPVLSAALGGALYKYFSREEDGVPDQGDDVAFVFENGCGGLSASIPSVSYLDCHDTDSDHIAMALTDALKVSESLVVKYMCSDGVKAEIERTINKICLLSTNDY